MRGGPKPLGDGFVELLPQAQLSALRAHDLDPAFARATVLAFLTYQYGQQGFDVDKMATETLKVAPDRRVVVAAAGATMGIGMGDFAKAYGVCAKYAPFVPDYTADQCAIEIALSTNSDWDVQEAARAAIRDDPSPIFDPFRVDAANRERTDPEALPGLVDIHRSQLTEVADLGVWLNNAFLLGGSTPVPFFSQEARELAVAEASNRRQDDPRNPWLAIMLIENARFDPTLPAEVPPPSPSTDRLQALHAQTHELWRAALPFGYQSGTFWRVGISADVSLWLEKPAGAIAAIPYVENALVLTNHDAGTISSVFSEYVWAVYDGLEYQDDVPTLYARNQTDAPEEVRCTLARLARMMEYVCQQPQSDGLFCPNRRPGTEVADILLKLQEPNYCPAVAAMSPSELAYTELRPVPGLFDPATYAGPASAP
jgi:hypothetical protein